MRVKNRRGAADLTCPCGNWLKHWERSTGFLAVRCGASMCTGAADVGAHVMTTGPHPIGGVVPLCARCNHREDDFETRDPIAPAVRQNTCGLTEVTPIRIRRSAFAPPRDLRRPFEF